MSTNNILFVFEGEKTEDQILASLKNFFLNENLIITCAYCNTLYQLYEEISKDEDLDTFIILKNKKQNEVTLKDYHRDDFAEVYMFFDYDGHDTQADDIKLKELLKFFNEETDKGKLYLSYPMVESLKHIYDLEAFKVLCVKCKENINYKNLVSKECLKEFIQFKKYTLKIWKILLLSHLKKMNFIVNNNYELPNEIIDQLNIFLKQLEKYINIDSTVGVLSAFPIFLHDYYGNQKLIELIKHK